MRSGTLQPSSRFHNVSNYNFKLPWPILMLISSQSFNLYAMDVSEVCVCVWDLVTCCCVHRSCCVGVILQCPPCVTDSMTWLAAVGIEEAGLMKTLFQPWQSPLSLQLCFIPPLHNQHFSYVVKLQYILKNNSVGLVFNLYLLVRIF